MRRLPPFLKDWFGESRPLFKGAWWAVDVCSSLDEKNKKRCCLDIVFCQIGLVGPATFLKGAGGGSNTLFKGGWGLFRENKGIGLFIFGNIRCKQSGIHRENGGAVTSDLGIMDIAVIQVIIVDLTSLRSGF